jgi:amidase
VDALMNAAVDFMKSQGATVIDIDRIFDPAAHDDSFEVMLYEYKYGLNQYFESLGDAAPIKSLAELIVFNEADSIELMYFDQEYLKMAQAKGDLNSPEYRNALRKMQQATREDGIDRVMDTHQLDAIIAPTGSPAWKTDWVNGDFYMLGSSSPAAISGYPNITVPMGFIDVLPVGISFFGRAWSEPLLLEIAYAYEVGTHHRQPPQFREK